MGEDIHHFCSVLKITSYTTVGKVHNNAFYTNDCYLLSTTFEDQIIFEEVDDWKALRPVRCLTHPFLSMEMFLTPTTKSDIKPGLSIVGIDIPLFAYQFKKWNDNNRKINPVERESLAQFISKVILPNMIHEYMDIALRNRVTYIYHNEDIPKDHRESSITSSYEKALEAPIHNVLNSINTTRLPYKKSLKEIPFLFAHSYWDAIPTAGNFLSPYSYYVTLLLYADWFFPLCSFIHSDQKVISQTAMIIRRIDRYINSTNSLAFMTKNIREDFLVKYNIIKANFSIEKETK